MNTSTGLGRNRNRADFAPAMPYSTGGMWGSVNLHPFNHNFRYAVDGYASIASHVAHLFLSGRPSKVTNFVVPVDVDAINRMVFGRTNPNVGEELFKRTEAKLNTPASVIDPTWILRVCASGFCIMVSEILRAMPHVMPDVCRPSILVTQAPARPRVFSKADCVNDGRIPTIASAEPLAIASESHHDKPAMSFAGSILENLAGWMRNENNLCRINNSHDDSNKSLGLESRSAYQCGRLLSL